MQLFRICPEPFLQNYSGLGASYQDGGRWNRAGIPVLYFALSPAVALLEMGNYLPTTPQLVPKSYRLGIYQLPDSVAYDELATHQLPEDWSRYPHPDSTQALGSAWLHQCQTLVLLAPSAAVPAGLERIAVFNPRHPGCQYLRLVNVTTELYNKRAFKGL